MSVYERHTLSNGLRVLTAPLPHAQSVACYIMLAAGSRYEDAANRGIAHFAEHMFFKGTEKRPTARDLSMEVDAIGGEFNAFTSKEYTGYYIRCAGEQRDQALDVLVDMLRNSKFDSEELEREKGVIIEEMNMYVDTPRDYVSSVYEELLFGSNPLGWETLGTKETIKAATRQTFLDYLGHWYTPPRMVVGSPGWSATTSCRCSRGSLGDMPGNGPAPRPGDGRADDRAAGAHPPQGLRPGERLPRRPVLPGRPPRPLRAAAARHRARHRDVVAALPRGARAARPRVLRLRVQRSFTDAGTLYAQAGVDLKRAEEAVEVIADEFRKLADEPVPAEELEKARALAKGRFVLQTESPNGLLIFGLRREVLEGRGCRADGDARRPRRRHGRRRAAGRAGRDRQPGHARCAVIGPFDDEAKFAALL